MILTRFCFSRLALLSNNQNEEAYEAYGKAIQLEPTNEGYKQNLKIVEEKIRASAASSFPDMGNLGGMMSMFNNPQFMNMASQIMSDPQMQNV
jgi:small glutamine-rich tetratricopeptide repeat-containing protein alpha